MSATAAVTRDSARVSLFPRDQSSSGEETARGAATSNAKVAASSNVPRSIPPSRSSTAGLDTLVLVAPSALGNVSTAGSASTSQVIAGYLSLILV